MNNTAKLIEQRQHQRFQVRDGAYTVLGYKPVAILQIMNISKNGVAVCYSSDEQQFNEVLELDIFIKDSNFYIEKIQAKTVFDAAMNGEHPVSSKKIRQRGLQFGDMKPIQEFQVNYLLQNYAM